MNSVVFWTQCHCREYPPTKHLTKSTSRHICTVSNQDYTSRYLTRVIKIQAMQKKKGVEHEDNIPDYPGDGLIQYEVKNTNLDKLSHRAVSLYYISLHTIITNTAIVHPYKLGVLKYLGRRKCLLWYNSQI